MRRRNSVWAAGLLWLSTPACATDAAVALLADGANPATTDAMLRNLATLARTCDWARRYDVIVFHEGGAAGDALRPRLAALRRRTGLRLRARDVSDVFAAPAPAFVDRPRRRGQRTFGLGYRRMCRFWFSGVFELEDVRNLTYLLRLDTDSELRCRADSRDPFEVMARRRAIYGYVAVKMDHQRVARNLTAFGAAYARRVPQIQDAFFRFPPNAHKNCPAPMFYTNFEIMDVSWTGQIFASRWGDAPLRWIQLALFASRTDLVCFGGEYDYVHGGRQDRCDLSFNLTARGCPIRESLRAARLRGAAARVAIQREDQWCYPVCS